MGAWNTARNYIEWTLDHIKAEHKEVKIYWKKTSSITSYRIFKKTSCATKGNNRKGT